MWRLGAGMGGPSVQQHPLEILYSVRDQLQEVTVVQRQLDLTKQDLPSYGWALQSVIAALGDLAATLAGQVDDIDRERLYRTALQDHPYEVIDHAVEYLGYLRGSLNAALEDAKGYRSRAEEVHESVRDEPRGDTTK